MRTDYSNEFFKKIQYTFSVVLLLLGVAVNAQVTEEEEYEKEQEKVEGYNTGSIIIDNPNSIVSAYAYDPVTNRYILSSTVAEYYVTYPVILTPDQYEELVLRENMREYYREKSKALDPNATPEQQKDLLPRYYVNSSFFETIFGGNTIDIKPQGSVEMDLGVRYTKQDNPQLSPRNRSTFTFDFDQRISMSLMGKVGTRLSVTANYDTESTFAFQNLVKLEYTPTEDDIIQSIEVGNVSFPLSNSLIRGAQSLFGVKAKLQFGKTTVTGIYSEQKSQTKTVTAQGGGTLQDFSVFALEYDADKHFFLSQYFRNRYDYTLRNYPLIDSRVQITRIEVWVTNRQNRINATENNSRNIIALQDLGESQLTEAPNDPFDITTETVGFGNGLNPTFFNEPVNSYPDNKNNKLDPDDIGTGSGWLASSIREIVTVDNSSFTVLSGEVAEGRDYSKLENARKLSTSEYTYHAQLGYISLNTKLNNDEVLAVAYQYTVGDEVFQVGEFGTDGVDATIVDQSDDGTVNNVSTQTLILKMLKSNLVNVNEPVWDLMMKNVYQIPNAYQLSQEDFRFNILYTDPSPLNYITPVLGPDGETVIDPFPPYTYADDPDLSVADTPLLKVFNVDRLNYTNDPQVGGDGFFDFIPGLTVDATNGRIIFTSVEPFGEHLFDKLRLNDTEDYFNGSEPTYNENQKKYVFRKLYKSTQADALQESAKNKFQLKGSFKSTGSNGISLGAFNIPQGSVVVTAGGRTLVEGQDYTVNYQMGTVQILDTSLAASNTPIEVSVENNATFGQQTRRFAGVNVEHKFNDKFLVGGTIINMSERPFTNKTNYGQESVNNTIFGLNANYSTEVPFFTRLVNKLPNMDTDVPSNFSIRGEVAYLKPGASKADQFNGEATTYVDDFEGSQTTIDMRSFSGWSLSSVPVIDGVSPPANDLSAGYKRAKLAWYSIDPSFYVTSAMPNGITNDDMSLNRTRRVYMDELYPQTDVVPGSTTVVTTLDLSYFPQERGPYNFNPDYTDGITAAEATENWAGITRPITSTNFEQTNVEYMQLWVMDPYYGPTADAGLANPANTGVIEINLGEISEDILKDNRKQYENGLPGTNGQATTFSTVWGEVPVSQSLIYAFDTDTGNRALQDAGYDGLLDGEEGAGTPYAGGAVDPDPAQDNYQFFLDASGDILDRYKNYNGTQGNSPVDIGSNNRGNTTLPDTEDINRDNTMNTIDAYYRYTINIEPGAVVGTGYLVDERITSTNLSLQNGQPGAARWLLYKIPVTVDESEVDRIVGGISSVRSIRFMRVFMTGFSEDITLRFGAMDLVRGEWRRYTNEFDNADGTDDEDLEFDQTGFDVVSLSIQENSQKEPIGYVSPPGVMREQLYSNNAVINQNEQALSLRVYSTTGSTANTSGLEPGDSRAVFKNVNVDMRQYKKMRMFFHAEALPSSGSTAVPETNALTSGEMKGFIRFGNDFTDNFYQVEMRLDVTAFNASSEEDVWPNDLVIPLEELTALKLQVLRGEVVPLDDEGAAYKDIDEYIRIRIKGNPNFGYVRTLMVGVRNGYEPEDAGARHLRGEVWFNELRLSELSSEGGMAATAAMDTNMADFLTLSATGNMSTIGFGSVDQSPNERSREDTKQYNIVTNINVGKLLPKKAGINLPVNYSVGEETITPQYDPYYQDVTLEQAMALAESDEERRNIKNRAIDYTKIRSINLIGVKKERAPEQKPHVYDPENITLGLSHTKTEHHDYQVENMLDHQVRVTADYNYVFQNKPVEPFKNTAFMKKSQYWKPLSDFNFNYLPSNISFSSAIIRQYNMQQFRNVDVDGIAISPLYRRNYFFNYQYGFNYNITKSLKFNYSAATSNIVRNYLDTDTGRPIDDYSVWKDFWDTGEPNTHTQKFVINYDLPLNKIPVLGFIKSTYSYTGTYNWLRSTDALAYYEEADGTTIALGNTIQNQNTHRLNTTFSMDVLYKYLGIGVKKAPKAAPKAAPKPGEKVTAAPKPQSGNSVFLDGVIGVLTSVKNIQVNYDESNGTLLPGYLPSIGFFGSTKPTMGFIWGSQDADVRYEAAKLGYLTSYQDYNQSFTQNATKTLNLTASVDLFPDLKIDLKADRSRTDNFSEQYDVSADGTYNPRSPYSYGFYSISTIMIGTAFEKADVNGSAAFDQFRENRMVIAERLAVQYYGVPADQLPRYQAGANEFATANAGYPVGFGRNSQAVLLPSFIAAYTGQDASSSSTGIFRNMPIPGWTIKYTGLMRYKFFKDRFKRFSLQSQYKATYNVNSFRSNLEYTQNPGGQDNSGVGNFYNKFIISNVNLTESFSPLVRVDMEMKNSMKITAEVRKDRTLNMSFDNNLLTEVRGNDYVLGLGYRIKDVIIHSTLADNPTNTIKSDINLKADLTLRKNETIVRYLDYDNNQLGGGQNMWSLKFTADYAFSKSLTAIFFYDHQFSKAVISTSYPITNIRSGFTLRYNFGN